MLKLDAIWKVFQTTIIIVANTSSIFEDVFATMVVVTNTSSILKNGLHASPAS